MEFNDLEFIFGPDVEYTLHIFVLLLLFFVFINWLYGIFTWKQLLFFRVYGILRLL